MVKLVVSRNKHNFYRDRIFHWLFNFVLSTFLCSTVDCRGVFRTPSNILDESAKLRTLRAKKVFVCQRALRAYVLTCQRALRAYVLTCQRALRAYVLTCQRALRAYVLTCQRVLCTYVLNCKRAILNNVNSYIIQIC